jgi:NAD(P)-dependent dehydrogenase (short-subunit alcohol dehydrogenase family)
MRDLSGRVAVVTGSASGIGFGLARRLAAEGVRVVMADVEEVALKTAEEELRAGGADVLAVVTDVSSAQSVEDLAVAAETHFGPVHLVCNNAGVGGGGPMGSLTHAQWEWVLGVNLWGVIHGISAFLPRMLAQGEGYVVNTASVAGLMSAPGMGPYCASKFAVVAISESLHLELSMQGSPVKVSVLCPGWVRTNIAESDRNWPARLGPMPVAAPDVARETAREFLRQHLVHGMPPEEVAGLVVDAIREERFWILTDPQMAGRAVDRAEGIIAGVNPSGFGLA